MPNDKGRGIVPEKVAGYWLVVTVYWGSLRFGVVGAHPCGRPLRAGIFIPEEGQGQPLQNHTKHQGSRCASRSYQNFNQRRPKSLPSFARIINKLKEAQINRQLLL